VYSNKSEKTKLVLPDLKEIIIVTIQVTIMLKLEIKATIILYLIQCTAQSGRDKATSRGLTHHSVKT